MNVLTNLLHSALGLFMVRKVDSILHEMSSGIARLEKAVEQHDAVADKAEAKATKATSKANAARAEADRAARISRRFRDLIA